jgi:hypothetical protein
MTVYIRALLIVTLLLLLLFPLAGGVGLQGQQPASAVSDSDPEPPDGLRFAVMGDTGTGDAFQFKIATHMLNEHKRRSYDFVLMLGDNIYGGDFKKIGKVFEEPYGPLLERGVKFYATLGNHDQRCADEEISYPLFNMNRRRAYSFAPRGDLVEFFTIDSTALLEGQLTDQLQWLDSALEASKARWKIAFFHHPIYSPGTRHGDNGAMISMVGPILKRRGARVVMTGHEHFFAKLRPVDGIDYIISGAGGKLHQGGLRKAGPRLEAGNDQMRHFLVVTLTPDRLVYSAIAETGKVIHRGTIRFQQ